MATWNDNAITDVGLELLEHTLTAGKTLTLSRAAVGGMWSPLNSRIRQNFHLFSQM